MFTFYSIKVHIHLTLQIMGMNIVNLDILVFIPKLSSLMSFTALMNVFDTPIISVVLSVLEFQPFWWTSCCNNYYTKECSKLVFQPLQNVIIALLIHYCFVSFIHSCRILLVRTTENWNWFYAEKINVTISRIQKRL